MTIAFANQQYPTEFEVPRDGTEHDLLGTVGIDRVESERGMATNGARWFRATVDATKEPDAYDVRLYGKVTPSDAWGLIFTAAGVLGGLVYSLPPQNIAGLFACRFTIRLAVGAGIDEFTFAASMSS